MTSHARILASSVALALAAGACGTPTGEAPPAATATKAAATRAPAAATATPAPAPKNLLIMLDTVRGQEGLTDEEKKLEPYGLHCVVMSRFPQGSRIVWRTKVLDPLTLRELDDKALEYVKITYPDGKSEALKYGGHGGTKENPWDRFWSVGYTLGKDYPTGIFNYRIEAKSVEGAIGSYGFDTFKVSYAQLTVIAATDTKRRY